ncbi:SDR family oxidoreductase [Paenibacillus chartarius]|uniref:SDR family oxidoreductase n=1 Tax=Paenibacillus chartarius TaxID=747481 RepID=A0ABV6DGS2_9BACL
MKLEGNTILITGGATGIGFALAERLVKLGNRVIVCGRREDKLDEARRKVPELHTYVCDVGSESDRIELAERVRHDFPELNVLINNAGIQQRINLQKAQGSWSYYKQEIAINVEAPIHLTMLLLPHLVERGVGAVVNVTSGLAFTPMAAAPVYSATKAAFHSFTVSLRHQLAATKIEVIEIVPPAVNTDLGGAGVHTFGVPLEEFADGVFRGLEQGLPEIGYGSSEKAMRMSREEIDAAAQMLARVPF